ncbi:hypothetical protein DRP04_11550 [Archaeoglobales archaeon]|nr:MAG: hypothetical protein DRP04_11550 [Archaeoglobales archaeon]
MAIEIPENILKSMIDYLNKAREEISRLYPPSVSSYLADLKSVACFLGDYKLAFALDYLIEVIDNLEYSDVFEKFSKYEDLRRMIEFFSKGKEDQTLLDFLAAEIPTEFSDFSKSLSNALDSIERYIKNEIDFKLVIESLVEFMKSADTLRKSQGW